jgi:head-tail adaptor
MVIRAGELKEQLIFEKPTWTKASSGAETATYTTHAIVHGSVSFGIEDRGSASENIESGQATAQRQGRIKIRYLQGIDETYRIKWGTKYLSIISIDDKDNRHHEMILMVRQYVN